MAPSLRILRARSAEAEGSRDAGYTRAMKKTLLAAALLAAGFVPANAQTTLPADLEAKVAAVVPEPLRAQRIAEGCRRFDAKRKASFEAMRAANAEVKSVFLSQGATEGNRRLSLNVFRDDRRKAAIGLVDTLLEIRGLASKKEWKAVWPEGYFAVPLPSALLAAKVREALPQVVADPGRRKQAEDVASGLAAAAKTNEAARKKAASRLTGLFESYDSERDEFIELVNGLETSQGKADDALVDGGGKLQKLLTPGEWAALVEKVRPAEP